MKLTFDSVEEVVKFVSTVKTDTYAIGQMNPEGIDPEELARSIGLIGQGGHHKIQAIKLYRAVTGKGLREAKEAVERYWSR